MPVPARRSRSPRRRSRRRRATSPSSRSRPRASASTIAARLSPTRPPSPTRSSRSLTLDSAILNGRVEGKPLPHRDNPSSRDPHHRVGRRAQTVETLVSQYVAFLDGRIHEVALDWYAQADDGSVWYFGEDVFNYEDGVVADTDGTWLAGQDGPAGDDHARQPQVGDVYRPENIPGLVFEEVTVKTIGVTSTARRARSPARSSSRSSTRTAPRGQDLRPRLRRVLHRRRGDLEALALAVPTDALAGPPPAELTTCRTGADDVFDAAEAEDWDGARRRSMAMTAAWDGYRRRGVPPLLDAQMSDALASLARRGRRRRRRRGAPGRDRRRARHPRLPAAPPAAGRDRPRPLRALGAPAPGRRRGRRRGGRAATSPPSSGSWTASRDHRPGRADHDRPHLLLLRDTVVERTTSPRRSREAAGAAQVPGAPEAPTISCPAR